MANIFLTKFTLETGAETCHIFDRQLRPEPCATLNLVGTGKIFAGLVLVQTREKAVKVVGSLIVGRIAVA